jgi:conjugal transfer mating pair stabilization protein TraG
VLTFPVYVLGDASSFYSVLNSVAMIFGQKGFILSTQLAAGLVALLACLAGALGKMAGDSKMGQHPITTPIMFAGMVAFMSIPTSVVIEDIYSGQTAKVDNVPLIITAPASLFTTGAYKIFDYSNTAYQNVNGSYMSVSTSGYVMPLKLLLSLRRGITSTEPYLAASVQQFIIDCVPGSTTFLKGDVTGGYGQAPDMLAYIVEKARPSGLTNYYDVSNIPNGTAMACPDAGQKILTAATAFYNSKKFENLVNKNANEKNPNDPKGQFKLADVESAITNIGQVGGMVGSSQQDTRAYALNALLYDTVNDTFRCMDSTASQQDFSTCTLTLNQAFEKWKAESASNGTFFTKMMTPAIVFLQLMFFGFAPIVILYSLFKGAGALPLYIKYLGFGVWTSSWLPFAAVIQMYIQSNVSDKLIAIQNGTGVLTPASLNAQFDVLGTRLALASDLLAATPMVSLALLSGSIYSLSSLAGKWNGQGHTDPGQVTPPVATAAPIMASMASAVDRQHGSVTGENAVKGTMRFNVANQSGIASAESTRASDTEAITQAMQRQLADANSSIRAGTMSFGNSQMDSTYQGWEIGNKVGLSTERGKGVQLSKEEAQNVAQDKTATLGLNSSIKAAIAGGLMNKIGGGGKLTSGQAQQAVESSIAAQTAKDPSFAARLFGDDAAAREDAWGTVAAGAYTVGSVAAGILTAPEGGAGGIAMAAMRTTVGAAFAKGTGRAISSVVGGAKNVSGKLKNIDGRELAQLYSDNTSSQATAAAQIALKHTDSFKSASTENQTEAVKVVKEWGMSEKKGAQHQNSTNRSDIKSDTQSHSDVDTAAQIFGNALQKSIATEQSYTASVSTASGQTISKDMGPEAVLQELNANPGSRQANAEKAFQYEQQDAKGWAKTMKEAQSFVGDKKFANREDHNAVLEAFALQIKDPNYVMGASDTPRSDHNANLAQPKKVDDAKVDKQLGSVAARTAEAVPTNMVPKVGEVPGKVGHLSETTAGGRPPVKEYLAEANNPGSGANRGDAGLKATGHEDMMRAGLKRPDAPAVTEVGDGAKQLENRLSDTRNIAIAAAGANVIGSAISGHLNANAGLDTKGEPIKGSNPPDSRPPVSTGSGAPPAGTHQPSNSPGRAPRLPKGKH